MDTKVNYTLIGAFVIILLSAIVLAIIWLSSGFSIADYSTYQVNMQEAVTGLSQDAIVEYNGVSVGLVKSIRLNRKGPHSVELLLEIKNDTPITQGTIATLSTRGITGITYISLKDKGEDLRALKAQRGQPYPIIKTGPSIFLRLDTAVRKLTDSMEQVSDTFQTLFDSDNLQSIKMILANTNQITSNIAANNAKLTDILRNTQLASERFPLLIQSSARAMQTLQMQTLPDASRIMTNLDRVTENLSALVSELRDNPSVLIRGRQPAPLGPGEK